MRNFPVERRAQIIFFNSLFWLRNEWNTEAKRVSKNVNINEMAAINCFFVHLRLFLISEIASNDKERLLSTIGK
jgi:hypothetical protein